MTAPEPTAPGALGRPLEGLSQRQLQQIFDNVFTFVALFTVDGVRVGANRAPLELLGVRREDVLGRPIWDGPWWAYSALEQARVRAAFARAVAGETVRAELRACLGHARFMTVDATFAPIKNDAGCIAQVVFSGVDITDRKRAELDAKEARRLLSEAQQIAHLGSWELDLGTGQLVWSDEVFRIFEIDQAVFGASYAAFLQAVHPDDRTMVDLAYTRSVQTRQPYSIVHRLRMPDGRIKHVHEHCKTYYDEHGRALRSVGTVQDISERVGFEAELRQARDQLEATLQAVPDLLFELDEAGSFLGFQAKQPKLLVAAPQDFLGRRLHEVLPAEVADIGMTALREAAQHGTSYGHAYKLTLADGEHWFELSVARKAPAATTGPSYVMLARDISDRKRAEQALQELNAELERRVRQRTAQLETANHQLETFAYTVSHDLKAPVRAVDGYGRLLLDTHAAELSADGRELVRSMIDAAQRMEQLIDDLLVYSRVEHATTELQAVSIEGLLAGLLAERSLELRARQVTVRVAVPFATLRADADGLTLALRNLLDNALKFSRGQPAPRIEIGGRDTSESWLLWVRDNGLGFDMKWHEQIFGIFQRLHSADDFPGTGVGLAIVRKSMQRMGGRAWAQSEPEQGAVFYLEIPK